MKIGITGCAGRMGRTLIKEVLATDGCSLVAGLERGDSDYLGIDLGKLIGDEILGVAVTDDVENFVSEVDAIIDFTAPHATMNLVKVAARQKAIHIIGTTGLSGEQKAQLEKYARETVIVQSPNMSLGVNILLGLVEQVASMLDESYDIEVLEMHHRHKVDAPSGTSLALGKAAADGRSAALADVAKYSREGIIGARKAGEIGFANLRGGDIVGDHTVIFAGDGERIELSHKASNRSIYARGAVRAALWAQDKKNGLYSLQNVLGMI